MKVRNDFVSNSSSSSFICTAEDARGIELFNKSEVLSLHEYLERFGDQEVLCSHWWTSNKPAMKFVDNETLCEKFKTGLFSTLPISAKKAYRMTPEDWDELMPYVEEALRPVWGKETFEYYEAEDCSEYGIVDDNDDWCLNNEESYLCRIFGNNNMKFSRVFNNH